MPNQQVKFSILLDNDVVQVSAHSGDRIAKFFQDLRKDSETAEYIPPMLASNSCEFYRLKDPVSLIRAKDDTMGNYEFVDKIRKACLEDKNQEAVIPGVNLVSELSEEFSEDYVCLVILLPDPEEDSQLEIDLLTTKHSGIFNRLIIMVNQLGVWTGADVLRNLRGGTITHSDNHHDFEDILEALKKECLYNVDADWGRDLENTYSSYETEFKDIFDAAGGETHTVKSGREFVAFYNVLRCFDEDVGNITRNNSSAVKASNHFIQPPFFSGGGDRVSEYHQKKSWEFPIYLHTPSALSDYQKFTPRSEIPLIISEAISKPSRSDRYQMLVQAIALARAGRYLLKSPLKKGFFVVAVYIDKAMVASRYIVRQTCSDDPEVSILRQDFDLANKPEQLNFLCEMCNLTTLITNLSGGLDEKKAIRLSRIMDGAKNIVSLSVPLDAKKPAASTAMPAIKKDETGERGEEEVEEDLGIAGDKRGCLKFVEEEKEIEILRYLSKIESPSNYTIPGVRFWPVEGSTVISMPVAGGWVTALKNPDKHLWSVAQQLFEAVGFMHKHKVAHLDLRPQNVIIPLEGDGRLSIINFSASVRVPTPGKKYTRVVGTKGYIAPEVQKRLYKPMLADLWSCGKTLEELCESCCGPSAERTELLKIARQLMNRDPEARPKMSTVLEWMRLKQMGDEDGSLALQSLQTVTPMSA